jgi:hypothetical protein
VKLNTHINKYSYLWVTLFLFLLSIIGHWYYAWNAYIDEQQQFNAETQLNEFLTQTLRDTFENWQSEFLQLIWQVAGLSFLFFVGSPQSKEGSERQEEKLDLILKKLDPKESDKEIKQLDKKYPKK